MQYSKYVSSILNQMSSVLVGKDDKVSYAILTLLAGGHLLLEDVPGVGKTTLANTLAQSIDCDFGRIQFTPDTLPSDVTGVSVYNMNTATFEYSKGAIMHNIVLADEINRTSPKTQASLLEAMGEKQVTVDGKIYPLEEPFMVIATQNPVDFLGTYNLPEAQLDRFLMKISLGYPDEEFEIQMVEHFIAGLHYNQLEPVASKEIILQMQKEVAQVRVHKDLIQYMISIVKTTRESDSIVLGASPRATLALIRASQAYAYMKDRAFVIPDDIQQVIYPVLCHRLVLSMESKISKVKPETILRNIIGRISVPIIRETD